MKLSADQVRHVAALARLALTPEEQARAAQQLSAILDAMEALAAVDTEGVPPSGQLTRGEHLRRDEVTSHMGAERALAAAPARTGTSFAIPRVIDP